MDDSVFRNAMGKFATGVTIITTKTSTETRGMTANAFMSVSLNPKLITISIDNNAYMLEKIKTSGKFAVNILSDQQQHISMHFAGQKKEKSRVDFDLINGVPVIKDSLASIVCDLDRSYEVGDHTLFIGKVVELNLKDGDPLTFYGGKYRSYQAAECVQQA
ncbi:flavin reductase family protein [Virgibacillus oceani]|uniref:Flavin oxidoreductase n=1 Tax=Virgibacillus oceani TaxID=1479511 RepID=A0A917HRJ1_9BACI|nr:flavin reductase family protein [Virgibacillus oceani]GGG88248.1 flavin oxidoreductase [Virgibacillus oceani]